MEIMPRYRGLLLAAALAALAGCGAPRRPVPPLRSPAPAPGEGVKVTLPGGAITIADPTGAKLWEASGELITWEGTSNIARMSKVDCNFIEGGKAVLSAQAPQVVAYIGERRVVLSEGVEARSNVQKASFRADRMEWAAADKKVYATGNVKLVRGPSQATGTRLVADLALRRVRMEGAKGAPVKLLLVE